MYLETIKEKFGLTVTVHPESGLLLCEGRPIYSDGDFWNNPEIIDHVTVELRETRQVNKLISAHGPVKTIPTAGEAAGEWFILMYEDKYFKKLNSFSELVQIGAEYYIIDHRGIRPAEYNIIPGMNNCNVIVTFGITIDKINEYGYIISVCDGHYPHYFTMFDYTISEPVGSSGIVVLKDKAGNTFKCWFGYGRSDSLGFYNIANGKYMGVKFASMSIPSTHEEIAGVPGKTNLYTLTLKTKKIQFYYHGSAHKFIIHSLMPITPPTV